MGAALGFTTLAETFSRVGVDEVPRPLKIGPDRIVHRAMAATHRNSMYADSFCLSASMPWNGLVPRGKGSEMKRMLFTHRTGTAEDMNKKKDEWRRTSDEYALLVYPSSFSFQRGFAGDS